MGKVDEKVEREVRKRLGRVLYERTKEDVEDFWGEFKKHSLVAITAAFGFLIALSWKDPISASVKLMVVSILGGDGTIFYQFLSAIIVTVISVLGLMAISKWSSRSQKGR